jgi:hypothetical protein
MTIFLKVKKINILLKSSLWIYRNKGNFFTIRCAIKFYMNFINTTFVYQRIFFLKNGIKVRTEFFSLILNLILSEPLVLFQFPSPIKS